jgi:tetratricopeptide (TPR) repeat protein
VARRVERKSVTRSTAGGESQSTASSRDVVRARVLLKANKLEEALAVTQKAVDNDPDNVDLLWRLALLQRDTGKADEAEATLERAALKDKGCVEAFALRMELWAAKGEEAKVREAIKAFKSDCADLVVASLIEYGLLGGVLHKPHEAAEALQKLTAAYPQDARVAQIHEAIKRVQDKASQAKQGSE